MLQGFLLRDEVDASQPCFPHLENSSCQQNVKIKRLSCNELKVKKKKLQTEAGMRGVGSREQFYFCLASVSIKWFEWGNCACPSSLHDNIQRSWTALTVMERK